MLLLQLSSTLSKQSLGFLHLRALMVIWYYLYNLQGAKPLSQHRRGREALASFYPFCPQHYCLFHYSLLHPLVPYHFFVDHSSYLKVTHPNLIGGRDELNPDSQASQIPIDLFINLEVDKAGTLLLWTFIHSVPLLHVHAPGGHINKQTLPLLNELFLRTFLL